MASTKGRFQKLPRFHREGAMRTPCMTFTFGLVLVMALNNLMGLARRWHPLQTSKLIDLLLDGYVLNILDGEHGRCNLSNFCRHSTIGRVEQHRECTARWLNNMGHWNELRWLLSMVRVKQLRGTHLVKMLGSVVSKNCHRVTLWWGWLGRTRLGVNVCSSPSWF